MKIEEMDRAIRAKCRAIRQAESAVEWRFRQGDAQGAHLPGFDDSDWNRVRLQHTWAGASGDAWFRRAFSFGDSIEGISTAGARIELPLLAPIHSAIYVDGVERVAEPSWLDTRAVPLPLCEHYRSGQSIQVTLHAHKGDGFGLFSAEHVEISSVEEHLLRLEILRQQLRFTHYLAYEGASRSDDWQAIWASAVALLDSRALADNQWEAWWEMARAARELLAPLAEEAKTYTCHLVGHSHIDMNWLWTWAETVDVIRRDFAAADALMERYPDFRFSQSQASVYKAMEDHHPDLLDRVRQRVTQGMWEVTASTWVEGDLNLVCGESLARHFLLTRPYIERLFGVCPRICWEPDTFGHAATLPQLLKQVGADYYYFCRAGRRQPLFWWEGLDGSRVLAFNDLLGYNGVVDPQAVVSPVMDLAGRHGLRRGLFLYGVGDHGGGATARDIERARLLDQTSLLPRAQMSDLISFYDSIKDSRAELPVIRGELNTTFEGCYTTHGDIKMYVRRLENALLGAESLATLARVFAGSSYPAEALAESWRALLFHHFHDIICGCSIGATYEEAAESLEPVLAKVASIGTTAARQLAQHVDTGTGHDARCVVFNPLAWPRTDVVRVPTNRFEAMPTALMDDAGHMLPVQVSGDELLFVATDVPALGCRVYRCAEGPTSSDLAITDEATIKNSVVSLRVHRGSGAIDSMVDLELNRAIDTMSTWHGVERKQNAGMINRLQILWEEPHPMSAWNIGDITRTRNLIRDAQVRTVERGPVRVTVEAEHNFLHSTITQRYCLYAGMRRVDVETDLDWHERGGKDVDAPMLRALFMPDLRQSVATFEVPFAGLERPATGDEVPALRWADVSDGEYGFALLNNGKYGHHVHGNTLGLTLVRSPYEPDNLPDQGLQSFAYALYPHAGDWRQAGVDRRGAEFNQPLVPVVTTAHGGDVKPGRDLLTCDPPNVMVTAVKGAESGEEAIIVRLVEMHGRGATARLRWSWEVKRVEVVNVLEERLRDLPCESHGCEIAVGKHKIVTLKVFLS